MDRRQQRANHNVKRKRTMERDQRHGRVARVRRFVETVADRRHDRWVEVHFNPADTWTRRARIMILSLLPAALLGYLWFLLWS